METQNNSRVVILPDELLNSDEDFPLIKLKHPRTGTPILCVLGKNHCLFEIVEFKEKYSSWFIGSDVLEDGGFHLVTPIDPTFFILTYLNKNGKYCPFEDCLIDSEYPDTKHLLSCCTPLDFEQVANVKDVSDLKVYAYDRKKTLSWLKKKVELSVQNMKENGVQMSDESRAADYNPTLNEKDDEKLYIHQSCRLMSEYLSDELSLELFNIFGLELEDSLENDKEALPKEKKFKDDVLTSANAFTNENLSPPEQDKKKTKMTASQKRLMKVDKSGMKSISSFFNKK